MACRLVALSGVLAASAVVRAQTPPAASTTGIFTCVDDKGRRLTADRPIAECTSREQRILNKDGSLRGIRAPTLTVDERTERDNLEAAAAEARAARADAVRRDRNLMARYPNESSHNRAREAALDTARLAMKATEVRLRELAAERKPLQDELEFYQGKAVPHKLKTQIDANDAALDAQRSAVANQEAEIRRITQLYDAELERLRKLWTGAQAGSLGPLPSARPPASAAGPGPASTNGRPPLR
jgi:chromosome segregation ATPase